MRQQRKRLRARAVEQRKTCAVQPNDDIGVLRQYVRDPTFRLYRGRSITIKTRKPLPVHVDAEPIGTTPVRIEVVPHCLSVVLPEHLPAHLFSEP